ncbi:glutathione S-transferase [Stachybotrys elegans]|uniref:Glutathione S-transferase n=1 Tax=Stachybotrys elegans TaxID=80388 RepID=A0A8K0WMF2_9HYPO|nr:glutathione S-transferase [Stachybotrys elegans]
MPQYTLYRANGSCSFAVNNLLRELSIPFDAVLMKLGPDGYAAADGTMTNAQYRSIHHAGQVPALKIDDEVLTEVPAILTYLASLAPPERNLLGSDGLSRARVVEWTNWISGFLHGYAVAMYWRPTRFTDNPDHYPALSARGALLSHTYYQRIDDWFREHDHMVGGADTIADYYVFVFWRMGMEMGIAMHDKFPNFGRFARRMESKPSVLATFEDEGLAPSFPRE